jgi:hypothetical protein
MLDRRIELESRESYNSRLTRRLEGWQRTYQFFWELSNAFGNRLFGGLAEGALQELNKVADRGIGRKRFFRVAGPLRIPLTPVAA